MIPRLFLQRIHYAPELAGRISPLPHAEHALAALPDMKQLLYTAGINEVIFCVNGLTYTDIFEQMQRCGVAYDYKIHLPGSMSFIGSNSSHTAGDLYTVDRRYNLANFSQLRNKRIIDIAFSLGFILLFPVLLFIVKQPGQFFINCFKVLFGTRTWTGYASTLVAQTHLPAIKRGITPPYNILEAYEPADEVRMQLNSVYAQQYTPGLDMSLMLKNIKYLGGKQ